MFPFHPLVSLIFIYILELAYNVALFIHIKLKYWNVFLKMQKYCILHMCFIQCINVMLWRTTPFYDAKWRDTACGAAARGLFVLLCWVSMVFALAMWRAVADAAGYGPPLIPISCRRQKLLRCYPSSDNFLHHIKALLPWSSSASVTG